jgi:ABC-type glycerol-3-phosphate transport system substrate-binding protein
MVLFSSNLTRWLRWLAPLVAGMALIIVSGCQTALFTGVKANSSPPTVTATATVHAAKTAATIVTTPTITSTSTLDDGALTLTFWTVEPVSPRAEGELGSFMNISLQAFEQDNPDLEVNLVLKKASGKGGILDFLRTAREVAPSILPDVVVMNATDLNQAYADGLLQTLDDRLDRPIVQDLLPAARRMGTVDDRLVGVPLGLEMEHTIYNTRTFTTTPVLWTDVLSSNAKYLFPAKGTNGLVNDVTLSQYLSAGGDFYNDQGTLEIDEQVLEDVLTFYDQALENKVIDASILEVATPEELWAEYLEGRADLAQVSVRQYLGDWETLNNTAYAPLPVQSDKDTPVAVTHGWALVLITNDINRQRAALRLMEWFLSTSNNARWNSLNKSIPSRGAAFQQLAGDDPYWAFLTEQLNTAQPQPGFSGYDQLGRIIQQAIEQVIRGEATPKEATVTAVDALTP